MPVAADGGERKGEVQLEWGGGQEKTCGWWVRGCDGSYQSPCVCVCVWTCVCVDVCVCVCVCLCVDVCMRVCMFVWMCYACVCLCGRVDVWMCVCMCQHVCVWICVCAFAKRMFVATTHTIRSRDHINRQVTPLTFA